MTDTNTTTEENVIDTPAVPEKTVGRMTLVWLCLFILFVAVVATGLFIQHQYQLQKDTLVSMQDQLLQQQAKMALDEEVRSREIDQQLVSQQRMVQEGLTDLAARIDSNATKLMALSSANRDDWKFVEINYLLRMADYRLLIEKDNQNALALATSADEILASLDQSGIQQIRKLLAEDIAVLRLAGRVDREGLYMRLAALANQLEAIPFVQPLGEDSEEVEEDITEKTLSQKLSGFFRSILHKLSAYVRVRDHGKSINAILPPAEQVYLRQNLRLMLEQAQAALLRGEGEVYKDSLVKAQNWVNQYYVLNAQAKTLLDELKQLEQESIAPEYTNFENTRTALQEFILRQQRAALRRGGRS